MLRHSSGLQKGCSGRGEQVAVSILVSVPVFFDLGIAEPWQSLGEFYFQLDQ
jgi:hypothetical protein